MTQLHGLKNDEIFLLEIIAKDMIKDLLQMLKSMTDSMSNLTNFNEYKSYKKFLLDIINLDQFKDRRLIVSGISNLENSCNKHFTFRRHVKFFD